MSESSVKIQTQAEIQAILDYTKAVTAAAVATRDLAAAQGELGHAGGAASGGGGGGVAPTGAAPPPPPVHPAAAAATRAGTAIPSGAPPPPPLPTGGPPAAPAPSGGVGSVIGAVAHGAVAGGAALFGAMFGGAFARGSGLPPPPPPAPVEDWTMPGEGDDPRDPTQPRRRRQRQPPRAPFPGRIMSMAENFLDNPVGATASGLYSAANTAAQVGLGTSILNFPFAALDTYVQLSKVITQVDAKFRDADGSALRFGNTMGYTISRSAQLAEALGSTVNSVAPREIGMPPRTTGGKPPDTTEVRDDFASRYLGFSRASGADPERLLRVLGTLTSLRGSPLGDQSGLASMMGAATTMNMGQGRFDEFLGMVEQSAKQQFAASGEMNVDPLLRSVAFSQFVHGEGSARAENDRTIMQGAHSMLSSKGGPMQAFMMRASGFGRGQESHRDFLLRQEKGIYDPENMRSFTQALIDRGVSGNNFFEAVLPFFETAWQADAFTKAFDSQEKLDSYMAGGGKDFESIGMQSLTAGLSETQRASLKAHMDGGGSGMEWLGRNKISLGEGIEVQQEAWRMNTGQELAKGLPGLMATLGNIGTILQNLLTMLGRSDWGGDLATIAGGMANATSFGARNSAELASGGVQGLIDVNRRNWGEFLESPTDKIDEIVGGGGSAAGSGGR